MWLWAASTHTVPYCTHVLGGSICMQICTTAVHWPVVVQATSVKQFQLVAYCDELSIFD